MRTGTAAILIALFIVLSGTAIALPGKNRVDRNDAKRGSIGTRAIANNSIRSQDIRTGNVRSSDINDGAVTGTDVDEGSLGQVPSAASAGSATKAATATTAGSANTANNAGFLDGIDSTGFLRNNQSRIRSTSNSNGTENYGHNASLLTLSNLAAGVYSVTGKVTINNDEVSGVAVTCTLNRDPGQTVLDSTVQIVGGFGLAASTLQYSSIAEVSTAGGGTSDLTLRCTNPAGTNDADDARLVAHKEN